MKIGCQKIMNNDNPVKKSGKHEHIHGFIDPSIINTEQGIRAVKLSFVILLSTALFQIFIVFYSGSIALFADTIHNAGDALTGIALWIAFALSKKKPTKRFTYGYGRMEDLAGVFIVLIILASAVIAGYESIERIIKPAAVKNLWAVMTASIIGFTGNEAAALMRIKTGRKIGSAALVADGHHARIDGLTSLAVFAGAIGVGLGFPMADPVIGLLITFMILKIVWDSGKSVFTRLIDGVDPDVIDEIMHALSHVPEVKGFSSIRVRWLGHQLFAELTIALNPKLNVEKAHNIALETQHELMHHVPYLSHATVHVDPFIPAGSLKKKPERHTHDHLPAHIHDFE